MIKTAKEMMELSKGQEVAALFDLDGVVFDTESQYSIFGA